MRAIKLLRKYFSGGNGAFDIVYEHSRLVADKALVIARSLGNPDLELDFIEEAALLHDIGIARIHSPRIGCRGSFPYICHGILGREILEAEGLPRHAMVCERHIGVGLTLEDITSQRLPLPHREMIPVSDEEKIICLADLHYSKKPGSISYEKSADEIRAGLLKFGGHKVEIFDEWLRKYRC